MLVNVGKREPPPTDWLQWLCEVLDELTVSVAVVYRLRDAARIQKGYTTAEHAKERLLPSTYVKSAGDLATSLTAEQIADLIVIWEKETDRFAKALYRGYGETRRKRAARRSAEHLLSSESFMAKGQVVRQTNEVAKMLGYSGERALKRMMKTPSACGGIFDDGASCTTCHRCLPR